jgi:acetylornithine deacetylase/succinyl-diaminopimelate desuccinylase-like protein
MARLEDLTRGAAVKGVLPDTLVTVVNAARPGRDASQIAEEVIAHLSGLVGAKVTITLEIQAELPAGASDAIVRTVTENCRTLRFRSFGFEEA